MESDGLQVFIRVFRISACQQQSMGSHLYVVTAPKVAKMLSLRDSLHAVNLKSKTPLQLDDLPQEILAECLEYVRTWSFKIGSCIFLHKT